MPHNPNFWCTGPLSPGGECSLATMPQYSIGGGGVDQLSYAKEIKLFKPPHHYPRNHCPEKHTLVTYATVPVVMPFHTPPSSGDWIGPDMEMLTSETESLCVPDDFLRMTLTENVENMIAVPKGRGA